MATVHEKIVDLASKGKISALETLRTTTEDLATKNKIAKIVTQLKAQKKASDAADTATRKAKEGAMGYLETLDDMTTKLSAANAAFALNRKAMGEQLNQVMKLRLRSIDLGATNEEVLNTYNELSKTLAVRLRKDFDQTSMALTNQAIIWKKFSVPVETSGRLMNQFTTTMGMSAKEINFTSRAMLDFAAKTGQAPLKVFNELNSTASRFYDILDSREATRTQLAFMARAKAMGTSVDSLMGVVNQFETISGAQRMGAQLNAVLAGLGGGFDAMKAAGMSYEERMQYVARSIQQVAPRIQASSPRAQRAYMRALAASFGGDIGMVRKFMQFKPGDMVDAEKDLTRGVMGAVTQGQERMMARRMQNFRALAGAGVELLGVGGVVAGGGALGATGRAAELVARGRGALMSEQRLAQAAITMAEKSGPAMAKSIGQWLDKAMTKDGESLGAKIGKISTALDSAEKNANALNARYIEEFTKLKKATVGR